MSKDTILSSIEDAVEDFRQGKFLIVVDDEDRENEGDFIIAAEAITPEKVNFMLANGRGVLCAPITMQRCEELNLYRQVNHNTSMLGTPFTVTIDKLRAVRQVFRATTGRLRYGLWPILLRRPRHSGVPDI